MAKVKKMAFGGMGSKVGSVLNAVKKKPMPGSVVLPGGPGGKNTYSTGPMPKVVLPGGPGGKNTYSTGPMPKGKPDYIGGPVDTSPAPFGNIANRLTGGPAPMPAKGAPNTFAGALLGGGAAPSQPAMTNKIGTSGFKNMSPATLQSGMKKGGSVKGWGMARGARKAKIV